MSHFSYLENNDKSKCFWVKCFYPTQTFTNTSQVQPSSHTHTQGGYETQMREHVYEVDLQVVNGYINQIIIIVIA